LDADIRHAHLRRHFQAMLESSGETATQGAMLKLASDRTFHWWHAFERDEIDQAELVRRMDPIQKETHQRLTILRDDPTVQKKARGIAKDLLRQWEAIWTFVTEDAAVPTNNEAYAACGIMKPSLPCARPSFGGRGASASTAKPAPGSWSAS
jgi:transposase